MVVAFSLAILGLLVWFALARKLSAERARHEIQLRLLQSAASAAELAELMKPMRLAVSWFPGDRQTRVSPGTAGRRNCGLCGGLVHRHRTGCPATYIVRLISKNILTD